MNVENNDDVPHEAGAGSHNQIFERLCDTPEDGEGEIIGLIAYGIYKHAKREWAKDIRAQHGRGPTPDELQAYIATWTESQFENVESRAASVVSSFADEIISAAEPEILKQALRGSCWSGVGQSIVGGALLSLILIALAILVANTGLDLLSIFSGEASSNNLPPQSPSGASAN